MQRKGNAIERNQKFRERRKNLSEKNIRKCCCEGEERGWKHNNNMEKQKQIDRKVRKRVTKYINKKTMT